MNETLSITLTYWHIVLLIVGWAALTFLGGFIAAWRKDRKKTRVYEVCVEMESLTDEQREELTKELLNFFRG